MTPDEYLERVLEQQRLSRPELDKLREHRTDVEAVLEQHFSGSDAVVLYAGSYKKKTMIRESYDLDLTYYFDRDDSEGGETLEEIYEAVFEALGESYHIQRKRSALRVMENSLHVSREDLRIDVVPGRYTGEERHDVFLHQEGGEKARLKTNPQVHVEHIRDCGVRDAIKLLKLWRHQRNVRIKTFVLELLVVELLKHRKTAKLSTQVTHILSEFRDNADDLYVEDPANSSNDLGPLLDEARLDLATWAQITLDYINNDDWESVFGKLPEEQKTNAGLTAAIAGAASKTTPNRPWLPIK